MTDQELEKALRARAEKWANTDITDHANYARWNRSAIHLRVAADTLRTGPDVARKAVRAKLDNLNLDQLEEQLRSGEDPFVTGLPHR